MPLAQLAEPWPKMELVQLESEVRTTQVMGICKISLWVYQFLSFLEPYEVRCLPVTCSIHHRCARALMPVSIGYSVANKVESETVPLCRRSWASCRSSVSDDLISQQAVNERS